MTWEGHGGMNVLVASAFPRRWRSVSPPADPAGWPSRLQSLCHRLLVGSDWEVDAGQAMIRGICLMLLWRLSRHIRLGSWCFGEGCWIDDDLCRTFGTMHEGPLLPLWVVLMGLESRFGTWPSMTLHRWYSSCPYGAPTRTVFGRFRFSNKMIATNNFPCIYNLTQTHWLIELHAFKNKVSDICSCPIRCRNPKTVAVVRLFNSNPLINRVARI